MILYIFEIALNILAVLFIYYIIGFFVLYHVLKNIENDLTKLFIIGMYATNPIGFMYYTFTN